MNFYRLNVELAENEIIQQGYGMRGHPSAVILDGDGNVVQKFFGVETAVTLRPILNEIAP